MDFPIGSLAVLVLFILVASGVVGVKEAQYRIMVLGLAVVLMGSFLSIPLPAPKGMQVSLNVGHTLVPALISAMFWLEARAEDKYRASVGILVVGLIMYGFTTLLDIEPGILRYPLLVSVPLISTVAALTGRTVMASTMAITGGSLLVVFIRYFEMTFSLQFKSFLELPGTLVWNNISLGTMVSISSFWGVDTVKRTLAKRKAARTCPVVWTQESLQIGPSPGEQEEMVSVD